MSTGAPQDQAPTRGSIERQLDVGLITVMVSAALVVVYGVVYLVSALRDDNESHPSTALGIAVVFLLLPGVVVFFTARSARRRLSVQVVSARLFSILSGVFAVLAGIPLVTSWVGLVAILAGLFTLTCALLLKRTQPS